MRRSTAGQTLEVSGFISFIIYTPVITIFIHHICIWILIEKLGIFDSTGVIQKVDKCHICHFDIETFFCKDLMSYFSSSFFVFTGSPSRLTLQLVLTPDGGIQAHCVLNILNPISDMVCHLKDGAADAMNVQILLQ